MRFVDRERQRSGPRPLRTRLLLFLVLFLGLSAGAGGGSCVGPPGEAPPQDSRGDGADPGPSSGPSSAPSSAALDALERSVLEEMNRARTDPEAYARFLDERLSHYQGTDLRLPDRPILRTEEGAAAAEEAIAFLRRVAPVEALELSAGLTRAARDLVSYQGPRGETGHEGSEGSMAWDRAERYGAWTGSIAENIQYGAETGREIVLSLIVDDGVPDRGHRENLFEPGFRTTGVACGPHEKYGTMCVTVFAQGFREERSSR